MRSDLGKWLPAGLVGARGGVGGATPAGNRMLLAGPAYVYKPGQV